MSSQPNKEKMMDHFDEDVTELQFLQSKPTCFIILGKPGCGKSTLAQKLSQYWRCELVNGTDTIVKEIELNTDIGKKMQEVLYKGESLSNDFVLQLIREKVTSLEVAHYGYVLDGMPVIDDNALSIHEQIEMIHNWKLSPDIVINVKCPDVDILSRRVGFRTDSYTGDVYPQQRWDPPASSPDKSIVQEGEGEEEEEGDDDEGFGEEVVLDFPEIDKESKNRLVHAPEHLKEHVEYANTAFKDVALTKIESYIADHNQQYVIELDGNLAPMNIFRQLLNKLDTYTFRRAVVPMRLQNPDEEELPDEIETDELLRMLASYQMPAPRYRWRRSKWGRICPVSLKEGDIFQGKPDLAVSFLDKIYVLSSPEAMTKFLKNPRPYLMPPMPAPPCKIAVLGFPKSGKSTTCRALAEKYKATVLDMKELMQDKLVEAKAEVVLKAKQEALEMAIVLVQNKLEQEALERNEARKAKALEAEAENENAMREDEDESNEASDSFNLTRNEDSLADTVDAREPSPVPTVTEEHHEVKKIVEEAVKSAEAQEIKLPPHDYVNVLEQAIEKLIAERLKEDPDAPKSGGWVLDNFPETKEQWAVMVEKSIVPDEVVFLADKTPNVEVVRQRYYEMNKDEITVAFRQRLINEKKRKLQEEENEQSRIKQEMEEQAQLETEKEEKAETGDGEVDTEASKAETDDNESRKEPTPPMLDDTTINHLRKEIEDLQDNYLGVPSYDAPEFQTLRDMLHEFDKEWGALQNAVTGSATSKPITIDILDMTTASMVDIVVKKIESMFGYRAWDFSGLDLDEEEEDAGAETEMGGEQEEEDEEALQHKKKHFGFSKHYDPVALKNENVLWPGNPDIAAKYRERIYYFKSTEFREVFVQNPVPFLPTDKSLSPPPPRILILGARGAGKTLHGRWLAEKLGTFHISFRERLQELILPKTGRKLGPEHEEDKLLKKEFSVTVEEAVKTALEADPNTSNPLEEEEKFDLTDEEEAIKSNLEDDEPLPPEIMEKIIPGWWRKEPYKSTGFILEGFPRTVEECQFLVQTGLYPDAALLLMVEDKDVITRLLPDRMQKWVKRRNHQNEKKNRIREEKDKIKNEKIEARRAVLLAEREQRRLQHEAERHENEEEEEDEEEEDIDEILANEFEDEEEAEEEEEEQEEDARDRIRGEYGEWFDDDVNKLQMVQEQLEESSIPRIEVQASRKPPVVKYLIETKMKAILEHRNGIFERVYPLSQAVADRMLTSGYKHPSSFGKWDPVNLHERDDVLQSVPSMSNPLLPVAYNQYVYYLSSIDSRNKFIADPERYIQSPHQAKPVVPIQIAVVGPPKCGKSTLSKRFADDYGACHISVGKCIRDVLEKQPNSVLSTHVKSHLYEGSVVPTSLAVECLATTLLDTICSTRGYVLDGFPNTEEQVQMLHKKGICPVKIIELAIDEKEVLLRAEKDRLANTVDYAVHDSDKITVLKQTWYKEQIEPVRKYYEKQHQNWLELDGKISKWKLWMTVLAQTKEGVRKIQNYLDHIGRGEAARLCDLCISPEEFKPRLGEYGQYCPVSLNARDELVDCSTNSSLEFAVEFRSKYYKLASKEDLMVFLANPQKYVPPMAEKALPGPDALPKRRSRTEVKAMFPKQVELNGYCPVTFFKGKLRYEGLVEGSADFMVEYNNKLYAMENEEKLDLFMKRPQLYFDLKLPNKLPPKKEIMNLTSLPMLGYLEQGAASCIIKALTTAGCFKPKFPFLSVKKSVLVYIATHLKAFNPRSSNYSRTKYQNMLKRLEECCMLITYLGSNMTRRYIEPDFRPIQFDEKMSLFLSLENHPPQKNGVK